MYTPIRQDTGVAYDESLAAEVRMRLPKPHLEEKRLFGGLAFMLNGKMCVTVNSRPDHVMMVRVARGCQDEALKREGAKLAVMRGREMPGWIFLTEEAIGTAQDLDYWIELALNFQTRLTA
ncbi:MAG: TfoX/Sxy family protein, partial [Tepidiformaceae bacterium]